MIDWLGGHSSGMLTERPCAFRERLSRESIRHCELPPSGLDFLGACRNGSHAPSGATIRSERPLPDARALSVPNPRAAHQFVTSGLLPSVRYSSGNDTSQIPVSRPALYEWPTRTKPLARRTLRVRVGRGLYDSDPALRSTFWRGSIKPMEIVHEATTVRIRIWPHVFVVQKYRKRIQIP